MVVVMPTPAMLIDPDERLFPALFVGGIAAIAKEMRHRCTTRLAMPDLGQLRRNTPSLASSRQNCTVSAAAQQELASESAQEEHEPGEQNDLDPEAVALELL